MKFLRVTFLLYFVILQTLSQTYEIPTVTDVSAMCTADGITASIYFDRPFSGIIYSVGYANVHTCVYFNGFMSSSVLFSIPTRGCGTRVRRNTHEVLETVENRVYVQMDKLTQTFADKQYSFVCQQAYVSSIKLSNEIRRHPVKSQAFYQQPISPVRGFPRPPENLGASFNRPITPMIDRDWRLHDTTTHPSLWEHQLDQKKENIEDLDLINGRESHHLDDFEDNYVTSSTQTSTTSRSHPFTLPIMDATTVIPTFHNHVNKLPFSENSRLEAKQKTEDFEQISDHVIMEILSGNGPQSPHVDKAIEMGSVITLVTKGKKLQSNRNYNMFVHGCYATDQNNTVKVELIDLRGCSVHSSVIGNMKKTENEDGSVVYFFPLKAFKFPNDNDVFFFCSVDISDNLQFPEPCVNQKRKARSSIILPESEKRWYEFYIHKSVEVGPSEAPIQTVNGESEDGMPGMLIAAIFLVIALTVSTITVLAIAIRKYSNPTKS
ncbi:unnamed protein product [Bursaphelenchus xylophilus]|uniref:(pine wood nematode) hypothetical protein n=1 Tax=Bursaphelenchus xylophilus TaxID=6326 RepID=A0A1I7SSX5_BURXY|nr:unnamed protein product [Bursaphelenchus xylophilus]CAG9108847.1 unnamed protein product [Bursaphelenchus xylophilus]